ncbi:MAG: metallophosphoesterase [Rickettsiaceae bacterium]|jgi:putative phosphoesterase|nr:MAG: metallophosphoesterase [Rickettsiaceae bacterium]
MKIALFSDVHGNLPALEAVLADIEAQQVDVCYCLGDLVDFAPWPNEVIDLLRRRNVLVIQGNHDAGIGAHRADFPYSYRTAAEEAAGRQAIACTNAAITDRNRAYLRTLPHNLLLDAGQQPPYLRVLLTHGSPADVNQYITPDYDAEGMLELLEEYGANILCMGHTHRPYHRVLATAQANQPAFKHTINVGSVGQPKDGDPRATWCLLELTEASTLAAADSVRVQHYRVAYDLARTVAAIQASAIPGLYAEALPRA